MKIALWCGLCVVWMSVGHVVLGLVALLLLTGCVPVHREPDVADQ